MTETLILLVNEYQLQGGYWPCVADVVLRRCAQSDASDLWAIKESGFCLNKQGQWELEPIPSSRDDDFIERCRFDTAIAAYAFWRDGGYKSRFSHYDE